MKKILGVVLILLIAGSVTAAEYWHLGIGLRGTAVIPGEDIESTIGLGIIASLGDPDSRFTTQLEVDKWTSVYTVGGLENQYSGLGAGFFEKFRVWDISPRLSTYIIGGVGGYFLNLKQEEDIEFVGIVLMPQYINSYYAVSGGAGIDFQFSPHIIIFTEGRYVDFPKGWDGDIIDKAISNGYLGLKYTF